MKHNQLLKKLKRLGVKVDPSKGKGGHVLLTFKGAQSTLPTSKDDLSPNFIKMICKQLGIDPHEL